MFTKNIFARVSELLVMKTSKGSFGIKVIWNGVDLALKIQTVKLLHTQKLCIEVAFICYIHLLVNQYFPTDRIR
jgi:hypothetical protein